MPVRIPDTLDALLVPIDAVLPDPANYNQHSAAQIEQIAASLVAFGFDQPILARRNGLIIAGHGRLLAARQVGMTHVPVVYTDLDGVDAARRMVGDNRLAALAEPDASALAELLRQLQAEDALGGTGYDDAAVDALLKEVGGAMPPADDPGPQVDRAAELQAKWGTVLGQVWALGEHRLVCGDCTDPSVVKSLLGDDEADLLLTDPPYGINVVQGLRASVGGSKPVTIGAVRARRPYPFGGVKNIRGSVGAANMVDATLYRPVHGDDKPFDPAHLMSIAKDAIMFGGNYYASKLPDSRCWIVWDKNNTGNFADAELAWTSFDKGVRLYQFTWNGLVREGERSIEGVKRFHPTQKPVGLFERILADFSEPNAVVIDCYLGSGTTLMACERQRRRCRGMEIDPAYVAVTLQRWADMTGQTPRLLES